jgi:hypothetical protein
MVCDVRREYAAREYQTHVKSSFGFIDGVYRNITDF